MARKNNNPSASPSRSTQATSPQISREKAITRLKRLLEKVPMLRSAASDETSRITVSWRQDVECVLNDFYGPDSLQMRQFRGIHYTPQYFAPGISFAERLQAKLSGIAQAEDFLGSRISEMEEDLAEEPDQKVVLPEEQEGATSSEVFVVHGHDHGTKETVARFLNQLELTPIILHEKPDAGQTVIEKFTKHSKVACAVVILTPDDTVVAKESLAPEEKRARQNVIFEMGFFIGRLGRGRTFVLVRDGVTQPSDTDGVIYIPVDAGDAWRMRLVRELKAAGIQVDANKAL